MDEQKLDRTDRLVGSEWIDMLRAAARAEGLGCDPAVVRMWTHGDWLIALVRFLGGRVCPAEPFSHWVLHVGFNPRKDALAEWVPDLREGEVGVEAFRGVMRVELEGRTYLVLCADAAASGYPSEPVTLVAGRSLEDTLAFVAGIKEARKTVERREPIVCGTTVRSGAWDPVAERALVLPSPFKETLLGYVDGYWRAVRRAGDWRATPTRGVLFVGKPGTGKTLTVRHLLGRYPDVRAFLYVNDGASRGEDSSFRGLVQRIEEHGEPAIALIEDIDRIFRSGATTPEFLLNVLDGLLRPSVPVLWLATSNDPSELQENLMDRPGRFDRVFVFPLPGPEEREALIRAYSEQPLSPDLVREVAACSDGFTGAHLREACIAASFRSVDEPECYPEALREEVRRMKELRRDAERTRKPAWRSEEVGFRAR